MKEKEILSITGHSKRTTYPCLYFAAIDCFIIVTIIIQWLKASEHPTCLKNLLSSKSRISCFENCKVSINRSVKSYFSMFVLILLITETCLHPAISLSGSQQRSSISDLKSYILIQCCCYSYALEK